MPPEKNPAPSGRLLGPLDGENGIVIPLVGFIAFTGAGITAPLWARPVLIPEPYAACVELLLLAVLATGMAGFPLLGLWVAFRSVRRAGRTWMENVNSAVVMSGVILTLGISGFLTPVLFGRAIWIGQEFKREPPRIALVPGGKGVEVTGTFENGLAARLERFLDSHPGVDVVHLTSPGGLGLEGNRVLDLIRSRNLSTYVPRYCESACSLAFAGGRERWIAGGARLGYHAPATPLLADLKSERISERGMKDLLRAGIPEEFALRANTVPPEDMWYPAVEHLTAFGIITGVAEDGRFPAHD